MAWGHVAEREFAPSLSDQGPRPSLGPIGERYLNAIDSLIVIVANHATDCVRFNGCGCCSCIVRWTAAQMTDPNPYAIAAHPMV